MIVYCTISLIMFENILSFLLLSFCNPFTNRYSKHTKRYSNTQCLLEQPTHNLVSQLSNHVIQVI